MYRAHICMYVCIYTYIYMRFLLLRIGLYMRESMQVLVFVGRSWQSASQDPFATIKMPFPLT